MCELTKSPIKILVKADNALVQNCITNKIKQFSNLIQIVPSNTDYKDENKILYDELDFLLIYFSDVIKKPTEFIAYLNSEYKNMNIVVLTFWDDLEYNKLLLKAGAFCFHVLTDNIENLLKSMETIKKTA